MNITTDIFKDIKKYYKDKKLKYLKTDTARYWIDSNKNICIVKYHSNYEYWKKIRCNSTYIINNIGIEYYIIPGKRVYPDEEK